MQHEMHGHASHGRAIGLGMTVMAVMMGMCLAGTIMNAAASPLGVVPAVGLAAPAGVAFATVSLRRHQWMGPLMALCCGLPVFFVAAPALGIVPAAALALLVGAVVGVVSSKLMSH